MTNRRFELFEYRQILVRMMGRTKLAVVREEAETRGWLDPASPMPHDTEIASVFGRIPKTVPSSRISTLEPYREQIRNWIAADVQGTTIHAALKRNHGYTGSYSAVRRMLQHLSAERGIKATTILEFAPADAAQVDFGAGPVLTIDGISLKTWIFVMTLCWSRHQYAEIVPDQTIETWLACHRRAFEWFGGCPARIIIDNAKCAIIRACRYDPAVQRSYAALAEGYGFRIDPCPPRDPQKKGIVESGVKYVKKSFVPLREFRDRTDANRQLCEWVTQEAGTRTHGTTQEQPLARFTIEKPLLRPLPDVPPKLSVWENVKLHRDGHVFYKYARYFAPYALVGKELWLKATDTVIQLFHQHELVATHPRQPSGGRHTVRDHQPPEAQAWLEHDPQWCLARAKEIGPSCHAVILALFNDAVLINLRGAQGILRLRKTVGDQRLDAACARALTFHSPKYRTVKGILDKGLESEAVQKPASTPADTYLNGGRFGRDLQSLLIH